jgi:hypothetical protein
MIESGMDKSRLAKLAALTQGVALVSSLTTACDRSQAGESTQPPMQAVPTAQAGPAVPTPQAEPTVDPAAASASAAPTDDTQSASTGRVPIRRFPVPNAMPGRRFRDRNDAGP